MTTCGKLPSFGDGRKRIDVLKFKGWRSILSGGFGYTKQKTEEKAKAEPKTNRSRVRYNPELDKPCGRAITWKTMAPIHKLPDEWKETPPKIRDIPSANPSEAKKFNEGVNQRYQSFSVIEDNI